MNVVDHHSASPRDNVLIRKNAIGAADLQFLANDVRQARMSDSLVSDFEGEAREGEVEWVVDTKIRDTQEVDLSGAVGRKLDSIVEAGVRAFINPFYGVQVRDREPLRILHYGVGGHYIPHVDAETLYKDDIGLEMWEKTLDRDLSIVCFLNDDFAGGELVFPGLGLTIKPEAGTLVCFPSDHHYVHGVNAVTSGHRYTLVTWMRVEGMPTMEEINRLAMDEYHRNWPEQTIQPSRVRKSTRGAGK
jgi:predicted 2-oxoglutarate/Fe(II)-dependent dioxygenase YbiX